VSVAERVQSETELSSRLVQYAGQWVAVIDYAVVQNADTWDELLERLDGEQRERAQVFRVPEHPDRINLY
jgi:hypothetical protein